MRQLLVIFVVLFLSSALNAQVRVNVNLNLGSQPAWGPAGYDYVENYYLPDIEVYYNVPMHRYYYYEGGHWIHRSSLPSRYRSFDLYHGRKVVINERDPWRNHRTYRDRYYSQDNRYEQQPKHDNGKHLGWYKGNNGNGNGHGKNK
jgi:hypothetical protein